MYINNVTEIGQSIIRPTIPNPNITFAIVIPILCFSAIAGNLLIIICFWKLPSLREKPSDFLILNLSIVDLITGLVTIPLFSPLYIIRGYWPLGENGCRLLAIFLNLTVHASLTTLVAISIDRLLLVLKDYPSYLKIQSQRKIAATIAICWLFALFTVVPQQGMWDVAKVLDESAANINFDTHCLSPARRLKSYSLTFFLALYFAPVIMVCACSIWFLYLLHKRLTKVKSSRETASHSTHTSGTRQVVPAGTSSNTSSSSAKNRYIKPAASLLALVLAMAICMLPYCFYVLIIELICQECVDLDILYGLLLLQFCNACLDPFFYGLTQRKIRQFYCSCFNSSRTIHGL